MIHLGDYNTLEILRETSVGLFLGNAAGDEVLLPNKYVPKSYEIGDTLVVFCYLDYDERPIATTLKPKISVNNFAYLKVFSVNEIGAFLEWGLEKHLFVPFREQVTPMLEGKSYLVYCYLDEKTNRLVGSSKTNKYLDQDTDYLKQFDKVSLLVSRNVDLGVEVIVNGKHKGLVYTNQIFKELRLGQQLIGWVRKLRADGKLDISLQELGYKNIAPTATSILEVLKNNNGFVNVTDKSDPEQIKTMFHMSKKSFKKGLGSLYKERLVELKPNGIYLKQQ
ncbi:MAG: S1-like domain-containing RNA-binding protein [Flavobacteriaceae bacterium]|nr:S1-like domain-containing RNA-binding protein [Flavobacteriaceae bacterium]